MILTLLITEIAQRYALLFGLLYVYAQLIPIWADNSPRRKLVVHTVLFSITAIFSMLVSEKLAPGYYTEARTPLVSIVAAWSGPIPAFAVALVTSIVRISISQDGLIGSVAAVMISAAVGSAFYYYRKRRAFRFEWRSVILFSLSVMLVKLASVLITPGQQALLMPTPSVVLVTLLIFPPGIAIAFHMLYNEERKFHVERAAREHQQQFAVAIQDSPVAIVIMRACNHQCVYANEQAGQIVGLSPAELIGKDLLTYYDITEGGQHIRETMAQEGHIYSYETRIQAADGTTRWVLLSLSPIRYQNEGCVFVAVQDVTEQKANAEKLAFSEARFRRFAEASNEGILMTEGGIVRDANQRAAHLFQYEPGELIGTPASQLLYPATPDVESTYSRAYEGTGLRKDGESFPAEITSRPMLHNNTVFGLTTIRDLTEHKQAEQQEFALAVEQERVQSLRVFIRNASHELRTPLSVINTSLYLAKKTDDAERRTGHLHNAETETLHLARMIDELMTISTLEQLTSLERTPIDINPLVLQLLLRLESRLQERGLHLETDLDPNLPLVAGDYDYLSTALNKLMENAVRYSYDGGIVTVRTELREAALRISVEDTGIGIAPDDLKRIFEPLYKASQSRTPDGSGIGLGLAIARRIVELHGGDICAESTPGLGSRFEIQLPVTAEFETINVPVFA